MIRWLYQSNAYLDAAKRLHKAQYGFSCTAIRDGDLSYKYRTVMLDGNHMPISYGHDLKALELRILLLCMMAACCKDFDDKGN